MSNEERIAILETTMLSINATLLDFKQDMNRRFDKIDDKFSKIDEKFTKIDEKFERMDNKFDALQNRLWTHFTWLMGMIIGLAGLIAHTQHWI